MAELTKYKSGQVLAIIRHNMRSLSDGNIGGNDAIVPELTHKNYSLIEIGKTCKEINAYRKKIERQCFKYNRKNLIHAVEIVIQAPSDLKEEQKEDFFRETFEHLTSKLPLGRDCVFVAEVHVDEKHIAPNGNIISKDHLHLMYVPAVPDTKHAGFSYKLCADSLTKRSDLKKLHPQLQEHLDSKGIRASVYSRKDDSGKAVGLSVSQLKKITAATGIVIDTSIENTLTTLQNTIDFQKESNLQIKEQLQNALHELEKAQNKIKELEQKTVQPERTWGVASNWGSPGWGQKEQTKTTEREITL